MNAKRAALLAIAVGGLAGCPPVPIPNGPLGGEGFRAFASARDFDGPGTLYRVAPDRTVYQVGTISVTVRNAKEKIPKMEDKVSLSLKELLNDVGVKAQEFPASITANSDATNDVTIESVDGTREYTDDRDVDAALPEAFAGIRIRPDNAYYLVRETVSTDNITYTSTKSWIATLGIEAQFKQAVSTKTNLDWSIGSTFSMSRKFDSPLRVWYKPERLDVSARLGMGPGQLPKVKRIPLGPDDTFRVPAITKLVP